MIILDTNVISELMHPLGADRVYRWVNQLRKADLFTTAVNQGEVALRLGQDGAWTKA